MRLKLWAIAICLGGLVLVTYGYWLGWIAVTAGLILMCCSGWRDQSRRIRQRK